METSTKPAAQLVISIDSGQNGILSLSAFTIKSDNEEAGKILERLKMIIKGVLDEEMQPSQSDLSHKKVYLQ